MAISGDRAKLGKKRPIGVRCTGPDHKGAILPYDIESGELLDGVESCTIHTELHTLGGEYRTTTAHIILGVAEPDPERTCLRAGAKAPTDGCSCSGCKPR